MLDLKKCIYENILKKSWQETNPWGPGYIGTKIAEYVPRDHRVQAPNGKVEITSIFS